MNRPNDIENYISIKTLDITKADVVHLNVFTENARAKKCYEGIGFAERHTVADVFAYKDELWGRCNMIIKRVK
jgi:RimJ/RimL family protein N-acetyltransferase